jgi:hypothetical protein
VDRRTVRHQARELAMRSAGGRLGTAAPPSAATGGDAAIDPSAPVSPARQAAPPSRTSGTRRTATGSGAHPRFPGPALAPQLSSRAITALARQDGSGNLHPDLAVAKAQGELALGVTGPHDQPA